MLVIEANYQGIFVVCWAGMISICLVISARNLQWQMFLFWGTFLEAWRQKNFERKKIANRWINFASESNAPCQLKKWNFCHFEVFYLFSNWNLKYLTLTKKYDERNSHKNCLPFVFSRERGENQKEKYEQNENLFHN